MSSNHFNCLLNLHLWPLLCRVFLLLRWLNECSSFKLSSILNEIFGLQRLLDFTVSVDFYLATKFIIHNFCFHEQFFSPFARSFCSTDSLVRRIVVYASVCVHSFNRNTQFSSAIKSGQIYACKCIEKFKSF